MGEGCCCGRKTWQRSKGPQDPAEDRQLIWSQNSPPPHFLPKYPERRLASVVSWKIFYKLAWVKVGGSRVYGVVLGPKGEKPKVFLLFQKRCSFYNATVFLSHPWCAGLMTSTASTQWEHLWKVKRLLSNCWMVCICSFFNPNCASLSRCCSTWVIINCTVLLVMLTSSCLGNHKLENFP